MFGNVIWTLIFLIKLVVFFIEQVRGVVQLYVIDLDSINGTYLNNKRIEPRRYYELLEKDVIKFGYSTRDYVVMTASTADSDNDGDA